MKELKISKELIRNVLEKETENLLDDFTFNIMDNYILFNDEGECQFEVNIYELAHKCKEWAWKKGLLYWYENNKLFIKILYSCKVDFSIDISTYEKPFDIIIDFKACNWILE